MLDPENQGSRGRGPAITGVRDLQSEAAAPSSDPCFRLQENPPEPRYARREGKKRAEDRIIKNIGLEESLEVMLKEKGCCCVLVFVGLYCSSAVQQGITQLPESRLESKNSVVLLV